MNRIGKPQLFRPISKVQSTSGKLSSASKQNSSPTNKETNLIEEFKTRFQVFTETASIFYKSHANFLVSASEFATNLNNSITSFSQFFSVLTRMCGQVPTTKQGRKPGLVSGASAIQTAANPFLKNWKMFSDVLVMFEAPQMKPFSDASYNALNDICKIDPTLINQMKIINENVEKFLVEGEDRKTLQMKAERSIDDVLLMPNISERVVKLLQSVVELMKASNQFIADVSVMFDDFASFQELLAYFIEKLDLKGKVVEIKAYKYHVNKEEKETVNEEKNVPKNIDFSLHPELDLFDFIADSRRAFEPEMTAHISMLFDALQESALNYKEKKQKEIENILKEKTSSITLVTQKNDELQGNVTSLTCENMKLIKNLKELEAELNKIKANTIYQDCLTETLKEDVTLLTKDQILGKLQALVENNNSAKAEEATNNEYKQSLMLVRESLKAFGPDELTAVSLAQSADKMYSSLKEEMEKIKKEKIALNKTAEEYKECIHQIVALFQQSENKETEFTRFAVQSAKNQLSILNKQIKDTEAAGIAKINGILEQFSKVNGTSSASIEDAFNLLNKKLENNDIFLKEVEVRLRKLVKQNIADKTNQTSVRNALNAVEGAFEKLSHSANESKDDGLAEIAKKLQTLSGDKEEIYPNESFQKSVEMIDTINRMVREMKKDRRANSQEMIQTKASLEMIYAKLKKFLNINSQKENEDLTVPQLMHQIMSMLDAFSKKNLDENNFTKEDIDKLCSEVLINGGLSNTSNPRLYLPEICFAFSVQRESINSLRPFNEALDYLFTHFDSKFASFKPTSNKFKYLRETVGKLQDCLNNLAPNRVSTEVFHSLSRFISLINSFMSAFVSLSAQSA